MRRLRKRRTYWPVKHGYATDAARSRTYNVWLNMRQRCENPKHPNYSKYGGRGIRVCARWAKFEDFLADMGEAPRNLKGTAKRKYLSLDRIDNSKGYSLANCRWATPTEQMYNMRRNRLLTFKGRTQPLKAWAREVGISFVTLRGRIVDGGWSVAEALTVPVSTSNRIRRLRRGG